jgi:hypothetical protein
MTKIWGHPFSLLPQPCIALHFFQNHQRLHIYMPRRMLVAFGWQRIGRRAAAAAEKLNSVGCSADWNSEIRYKMFKLAVENCASATVTNNGFLKR